MKLRRWEDVNVAQGISCNTQRGGGGVRRGHTGTGEGREQMGK